MTHWLVNPQDSILYNAGTVIDTRAWGTWVLATGLMAFIGLYTNSKQLAMYGGFFGFCAWLFASIALIEAGNWFALIALGLFNLVFQGYIYLASAIGAINRRAYDPREHI